MGKFSKLIKNSRELFQVEKLVKSKEWPKSTQKYLKE